MALIKNIETASGATVSYHRINSITIDRMANTASVVVGSYVDKDLRFLGKPPLASEWFSYDIFNYPFTDGGNTLQEAYLALKQTEMYQEATDDL